MSLPTLAVQTFECTLPESKQVVKFRPFVVAEEKILMLAASNKDNEKFDETFSQIINVLRACTFDKLRVDKLSSIDFEYLFIRVKIASKGSVDSQIYNCTREITTGDVTNPTTKCNTQMNLDINFDEIKLDGEIPDRTIEIDDDLSITMMIPSLDIITKLKSADLDEIELLACCLESVLYKGELSTEFDLDEANDFIKSLNERQIKPLADFFKNIPQLTYSTKIQCNKCKHVHEFNIRGIENFFG